MPPDSGTHRLRRVNEILSAPDLVTTVNYNEAGKTTVSGVEYTSSSLGYNMYETFVSGTQTLIITRSKT